MPAQTSLWVTFFIWFSPSFFLLFIFPILNISSSSYILRITLFPQFYWLNLNVGYDGDVYVTIVLNGFIHTVMYTYYFVSLHTKDIWWKSALTMCQMVQFVVMNAQAMYLISTECTEFPRNITLAYGYYIVTLLLLFAHFFVMSYMVGGSRKEKNGNRAKKLNWIGFTKMCWV